MGEGRMEEGQREGRRENEGERKRVGGERKRLRIGSQDCGSWQISKASWRSREEPVLQPSVQNLEVADCKQNSLFLGELLSLLLRTSTDWMRPTHIMKGNPLHSKSTDLNVNHKLKKMPCSNI